MLHVSFICVTEPQSHLSQEQSHTGFHGFMPSPTFPAGLPGIHYAIRSHKIRLHMQYRATGRFVLQRQAQERSWTSAQQRGSVGVSSVSQACRFFEGGFYYLIFQCLAQQGKGEARRAPLGYGYTVGCRLLAVQMICITSSLPPGKIDYSGCEQWAF
jgi:hypothetical protein